MVSISFEEETDKINIVIGLSHKVSEFSSLDVHLLNSEGSHLDKTSYDLRPHNTHKNISSSWVFNLKKDLLES